MKNLFPLFIVLLSINLSAQVVSKKYQRAKIFYNSQEDLIHLSSMDITIDHGIKKKNRFIISDFSVSELERAKKAGYVVEVLIEDSQAYFLEQNKKTTVAKKNTTCNDNTVVYNEPTNFNLGSMGGYLTYQEVLDELNDMRTQYPNLISMPSNISTFLTEGQPDNSVTPSIGGNGIKWVKITDNPDSDSSVENEPQILYNSLHHAREPMTLMQLIFYMWYLLENYDTDIEVQNIVNNTELFFVPVVNPDGYLYNQLTNPNGGGFWRKNRKNGYGVDNNRNYNFYVNGNPSNGVWGGPGSSSSTSSEIYRGTSPFSEVENQAMKWLVENNNFVIALNNHSYGELLYFPHAYANVPTPDEALYETMTSKLVSQNNYNNFRDYPYSGDSDDFMYGTVGTHNKILALTPEIGTSFWHSSNLIVSKSQEMMFFNLTAANMVNNYATIKDNTSDFIQTTSTNIDYTIKRLGIAESGNFTVSINPISSNIVSVGNSNVHNNLTYGQSIDDFITLNLEPSISNGATITYELIINNGAFDRKTTRTKTYGQTTLALDEPANNVTTNWTTNGWLTTTESFVSSSSSITDSPNTNYSNNQNRVITLSNEINLSGVLAANLTFQAKWDIENNYDYVQIEISTNNGASWIPQCGNFTNNGVSNQSGALNEPLYDGTQNDWVLETINLSDYLNNRILIRFKLITDSNTVGDGFYFDDLKINILEPTLGTEDFVKKNFNIYPIPTQNQLYINTQIENYSLQIFSIQGQLLFSSDNNAGNTSFNYSEYAEGIYLLTIKSEKGSKTFKILKQ